MNQDKVHTQKRTIHLKQILCSLSSLAGFIRLCLGSLARLVSLCLSSFRRLGLRRLSKKKRLTSSLEDLIQDLCITTFSRNTKISTENRSADGSTVPRVKRTHPGWCSWCPFHVKFKIAQIALDTEDWIKDWINRT